MKWRGSRRRQLPGVGCELRMLLPAQRRCAQLDAVMLCALWRLGNPARGAECRERRAVCLAALRGGLEGEVQHPAWRLNRRERARVHLTEHCGAQRMRCERSASD